MATESQAVAGKPSAKRQAWFCTNGLPSDIVIEVDDMAFHLHKFPLMSKSRKLDNLITQREENYVTPTRENQNEITESEEQEEDEVEEEHCHIVLSDFPCSSEIFEMASKFCYGVKIDLNSSNVASLRCAGEFLEMTEEYSEDNLISKTERFLSQTVLKSSKESIKTLKSCEPVMPLAETLGITQRCIASIASKAHSSDPALFGWPVRDEANDAQDHTKQMLWNGIETGGRKKSGGRGSNGVSWFEDLAQLSLPLFKQLIFSMRDQDVSSEIIESCLMNYAKKYIPGISRSNRKPSLPSSSSSSMLTETEQKELLETIISNLPLEKSSKTSTATRFHFGLLRTANILNASEACKAALEKKIGSQLEQATLDDLLIPSYSYLNETLYDVGCVERILSCFLDGFVERNATEDNQAEDDGLRSPALMLVGKLIDGYLAEIASDSNLKLEKFYNLAISLPEQARLFDDGVYRAVDVYLKAHPWISEAERDKICGVIDCQKLTLEACTHAAQNDRLPLRAVVQVLFFEQLQLRHAIAGTLIAAEPVPAETGRFSTVSRRETEEMQQGDEMEDEVPAGIAHESGTWRETVRENQMLRLDMDSMRTRVHQLERECSTMKKLIDKIDKPEAEPQDGGRRWRGSLIRRFGCKFKTQVCDSHESAVLDGRRGRNHHPQQ
ncbi:BTB/POZ domain-containing protein At5g66560-like [Cucurbita moschata]|uniref:BTB/POZ domain-containing protein At5g66560-like n=1 Tax=Cucurbita moschata TaxID=3662 RepID=A0A6J1HI07_CUCMO|nr:BTB/POZ domain-containing protein At5g66560-like [Cucurbita moschata]XP_022962764.1 BTB/POZ domain-containing protein At5g66560-like [Cucurbita moschata]